MVEQLLGIMSNVKAQVLEPVMVKGAPKEEDFQRLDELAEKILASHKELGIVN